MSPELQNLISLLELEKIEEGIYRGQSEDLGLPQVFGGKLLVKPCTQRNRLSPKVA